MKRKNAYRFTQFKDRKGESMKKKIALLLVLAMILSLVPANLFAREVVTPIDRPSNATGMEEPQNFTINIDGRDIRGAIARQRLAAPTTGEALRLYVNLTGAGNDYLRFYETDVKVPLTIASNDLTDQLVGWEAWWVTTGLQSGVIFLVNVASAAAINWTGATPWVPGETLDPNVTGVLGINIPVQRVRHADSYMTVRIHNPGGIVISRGPLASWEAGGLTINGGSPVAFEWVAELGAITITENVQGALTDLVGGATTDVDDEGVVTGRPNRFLAIRLIAQPGYVWGHGTNEVRPAYVPDELRLSSPRGILTFGNTLLVQEADGDDPEIRANRIATYVYPNGNRQELLIVVETLGRGALGALPGQLRIDGLELVPVDAPRTGPVDVEVRVGTVYASRMHGWHATVNPTGWTTYCYHGLQWGQMPLTQAAVDLALNPNNNTGFPASWPAGLLTAAAVTAMPLRPLCGLSTGWDVAGGADEECAIGLPDALAGVFRLGFRQAAYYHKRVANRVVAGLTLYVRGDLPELRSGHAADDGLYITGASARVELQEAVRGALHLSHAHPLYFTFENAEGLRLMEMRYRLVPHGENPDWDGGWIRRGTAAYTGNAFLRMTNNSVRLNTRHPEAARRTLQIEFRFSVEAGYEAKYGDEITVVVSGAGAENLGTAAEARTAVVANVYDPVTVVGGNRITVPADFNEMNIQHENIGNFVITETETGRLREGDILWVFVHRRYIQRQWDIIVSRFDTPVLSGAGFEAVTSRERVWLPTVFGGAMDVIQIEVTSEADEDAIASIALNNVHVFGHVYPGEVYTLMVTGPGIARNHNLVSAANVEGEGGFEGTGAPFNPLGTFSSVPYGIENFIVSEEYVMGNRARSLAGVIFNPDVALGGVVPPVIWERLEGMRFAAGFVAVRSFAAAAGVDYTNDVVWDTNVGTVSGWDYAGNWITIELTQGSTQMTITGGPNAGTHDIASFADYLSGPQGTVTPLFRHNRMYLPFRAMFNAFGYNDYYTLDRIGNNAVISLR